MPKSTQIVVNSRSSGKYREQTINGRPHLVTSMVSLEGDSVMNRMFYPAAEVQTAHTQLDRLPAPAGHPVVEGKFVTANDPLAVNAHNVGAMVLAPRMEGLAVINDLALDIEVANKDERGQEIIRRIKEGEQIGVSTGLNAMRIRNQGVHNGRAHEYELRGITFDHVAILLDENPAGENTYTLNRQGDLGDTLICNLSESVNELRDEVNEAARARFKSAGGDSYVWLQDILLEPLRAVVEIEGVDGVQILVVPFGYDDGGNVIFTGDGVEVERRTKYEPVNNSEDPAMDKTKLALAIIANTGNTFTVNDQALLENMSEVELVNTLAAKTVHPDATAEQARALVEADGSRVLNADDTGAYAKFQEHREDFDAYLANKDAERKTKVDEIVANSDLTVEDLTDHSDEQLDRLTSSLTAANAQDYSQGGAGRSHRSDGSGNSSGLKWD